MTPADHANTVREALELLVRISPNAEDNAGVDGLAALDALQTQAETAKQARLAFVEAQTAMRERAEAAEAERDHARDALRDAYKWIDDSMHIADDDLEGGHALLLRISQVIVI